MSVSAEAARRDDCLELREIEVADLLQCLGKSAIVQVLGQGFEPGGILRLQSGQLGDSIAPAFGTAAMGAGSARILTPIAGARVRARRKWPVSGESGRRFMIQ